MCSYPGDPAALQHLARLGNAGADSQEASTVLPEGAAMPLSDIPQKRSTNNLS